MEIRSLRTDGETGEQTMSKTKGSISIKNPICHDKRKCFARQGKICLALSSTYDDGQCPFCKESASVKYGHKAARRTPKVELWR